MNDIERSVKEMAEILSEVDGREWHYLDEEDPDCWAEESSFKVDRSALFTPCGLKESEVHLFTEEASQVTCIKCLGLINRRDQI